MTPRTLGLRSSWARLRHLLALRAPRPIILRQLLILWRLIVWSRCGC